MTNKLLAPLILPELSGDPATPPSGFMALYANTSGQLRVKNDAGTATTITGTAGTNGSNPAPTILGTERSTTSQSLVDCTDLSASLTSGVLYQFRFLVRWQSTATTNGIWLSVNGPTTTHLSWRSFTPTSATAVITRFQNTWNSGATTTACGTANADFFSIVEGLVKPSANGTLILRFASELGSQTAKIMVDSTLQLWTP